MADFWNVFKRRLLLGALLQLARNAFASRASQAVVPSHGCCWVAFYGSICRGGGKKIAFFLGSPFPVPQGLAWVSFLCPSPTQKVCCVECGFWQSPVVQVRTQGTLTVCLASPPIMRTLASNLHLLVLHLACNLLA